MKNFDVKSAVMGLLLGICAMLMAGAAGSNIADVGRYKVSAAGDSSNVCFVIDTATGRTWRRYTSTSSGYMGCPQDWDKQAKQ